MLDRLKSLFAAPTPAHRHSHDELHLAAAALLAEAARLDGHVSESEWAAIARVLERRFSLTAGEATELVKAGHDAAEGSTQLFEFTRVIGRDFSAEERIELFEMIYEVIYADGTLHDHEASLMRRLGELIYVSDRDRAAAQLRVLKRLGLRT